MNFYKFTTFLPKINGCVHTSYFYFTWNWFVYVSTYICKFFLNLLHMYQNQWGTGIYVYLFFKVMVFNATFNNISVISWWSVLLVEETGVLRENHRPAPSHWPSLSHNVVSSLHGIQTHNISVIGTDYTGSTSCKSTYHHWCCGFKSRSGRGVQHYAIKFVSDLRQVGGFLRVLLRFPPPIKLTTKI